MAKQTRTQRRVKPKHRAVKPRTERPLDKARADNHAARHEAAKVTRAAHEARMKAQAEEKAAPLANQDELPAYQEVVPADVPRPINQDELPAYQDVEQAAEKAEREQAEADAERLKDHE